MTFASTLNPRVLDPRTHDPPAPALCDLGPNST